MENVLDNEINEIRRRTAALSNHLRNLSDSSSVHSSPSHSSSTPRNSSTSSPPATPHSKSPINSLSGSSSSTCQSPGRDDLHKSQIFLSLINKSAENSPSFQSQQNSHKEPIICDKDLLYNKRNLELGKFTSDPINKKSINSNNLSSSIAKDEINITLSTMNDKQTNSNSSVKAYYCTGPNNTSQTITVEHWNGGSRQHLVTVEQRAHSEPPFQPDEGLYRARSYPGLPRPCNSCEGQEETVGALVSDLQMVRLRSNPKQVAGGKNKMVNRYSCGSLDFHVPHPDENSFDSCPDFGKLHPCSLGGDSLQSSNSSLSSHSSFTRLLQVS